MALTINRYRKDDSYIVEQHSNRVKIDFQKATRFFIEMVEQRGDNDMGNIILRLFERDDEYGTRLGLFKEILSTLEIKAEDLDFLVLADNEYGVDTNYFYKSEYIQNILERIEKNKEYLLANFRFPHPQCMIGIAEGLAFAQKAAKEGDLILFAYQ